MCFLCICVDKFLIFFFSVRRKMGRKCLKFLGIRFKKCVNSVIKQSINFFVFSVHFEVDHCLVNFSICVNSIEKRIRGSTYLELYESIISIILYEIFYSSCF